jgi:STE24 endopeptidase
MAEYSIEKARAYEKKKEALTLFDLLLTPIILLVAAATPLSLWIKDAASEMTSNPYGLAVIYFAFFSLYTLVFNAPMAFYSGFILEKRYELSNHTLVSWALDFLKKALLSFAFSALLILAMYALIWHFPATWWVFAWAGFATVSYVLGKLFPGGDRAAFL